MIYILTTDRQTVNYYSTIHALEVIHFDSNTQINGIKVAETVNIVQLCAIAMQVSRQIFDCMPVFTHLLRLLCDKKKLHRLTVLEGIVVTNTMEMGKVM